MATVAWKQTTGKMVFEIDLIMGSPFRLTVSKRRWVAHVLEALVEVE